MGMHLSSILHDVDPVTLPASLLLQAPTGAGKTTWLMEKLLAANQRAWVVVPLRALASELHGRWGHTGKVRVSTSRESLGSPDAPVVITTVERASLWIRSKRNDIPPLVAVDEIHMLEKEGRGEELELLLHLIRTLSPATRLILMSATIGPSRLAHTLRAGFLDLGLGSHVPVRFVAASSRKEALFEELDALPAIVFVHSRSRTESLAHTLEERGLRSAPHHAGLSVQRRRRVERAFREGELDVLVATPTVEMGLNLPARRVILYDSFLPTGHGWRLLTGREILQRAGRAGRFGEGDAVVLVSDPALGPWTIRNLPQLQADLRVESFLTTELGLFGHTVRSLLRSAASLPTARLEGSRILETLEAWERAGLVSKEGDRLLPSRAVKASARTMVPVHLIEATMEMLRDGAHPIGVVARAVLHEGSAELMPSEWRWIPASHTPGALVELHALVVGCHAWKERLRGARWEGLASLLGRLAWALSMVMGRPQDTKARNLIRALRTFSEGRIPEGYGDPGCVPIGEGTAKRLMGIEEEHPHLVARALGLRTRKTADGWLVEGGSEKRLVRDGSCPCPAFSSHGICKHVVAVRMMEVLTGG